MGVAAVMPMSICPACMLQGLEFDDVFLVRLC